MLQADDPNESEEVKSDIGGEEEPTESETSSSVNNTEPSNKTAASTKATTLETLPLDSLQSIAGFLSISDFCNGFGLANNNCRAISKEVLRRVRRHGFYCATQVMSGYLVSPDDAVQLAGLYISRGIPMYCNHTKAYATVLFRMKQANRFRSNSYLQEKANEMLVGQKLKIHQHLLDVHQEGTNKYVDDINTTSFQLSLSAGNHRRETKQKNPSYLGSVELEVYSVESLKEETKLQDTIAKYQRKIAAVMDDATAYEDCMLDFWDEFFPESKGMHYYDSETAVPRESYLREFLTKPCPKAWGTIQCEIERIKTGSRLFPVYEYRLYVRGIPNDMELMFARNKGRQEGKSNNYQLLMGNDVLGRLQSNFIGTEFQIFVSEGENDAEEERPKRTNRRAVANQTDAREDGAITYTANLLGSRPRIMDVCLPKIGDTEATWTNYLASCDDPTDMLTCFRQLVARLDDENDTSEVPEYGLLALQNRPPWWNHELQSFVLNFGGRVSVASVKNFQLIERSNHDLVMLQFGRIKGRHSFTMDFQYPLTAVQAFAIAISSLQSKISFG